MRKNSDSMQVLATQDFFSPDSNKIKKTEQFIRHSIDFNRQQFCCLQ